MKNWKILMAGVAAALLANLPVWAETVELVTYFPASSSGYDPDPNFNSLAVGPSTGYADSETPGNGIAIIENRLGIGTPTPELALDVRASGNAVWQPAANSWTNGGRTLLSVVRITNTNSGGYDPVFIGRATTQGGGGTPVSVDVFGIGAVGTGAWMTGSSATQISDLYFVLRDNANLLRERMRITSAGNVGIGTTAPARRLDVNGTSNFMDTMSFGNQTEGVISWGTMGGNPGFGILASAGRGLSLGSGGAWDKLVINVSGNVGIGTASPSRQLEIAGTAAAIIPLRLANYNQGGSTSTSLEFAHDTGIGSMAFSTLMTQKTAATSHTMVFSVANSGTTTERMRIMPSGNVGIGTTAPANLLEVSGSAAGLVSPFRVSNTSISSSSLNASELQLRVTKSTGGQSIGSIRMEQYSTNQLGCNLFLMPSNLIGTTFKAVMIGTNGNVQIGGISDGQLPSNYRLQIDGPLYINSTQTEKNGATGWTNPSDARLKKNIQPIDGALEKMLGLQGITFQWKEPEKRSNETGTYMGMLAHDVEKVFPNWVGWNPEGYQTLTAQGFEALTVEAVRELKAENDRLRSRVEKLEAELAGPRETQKSGSSAR